MSKVPCKYCSVGLHREPGDERLCADCREMLQNVSNESWWDLALKMRQFLSATERVSSRYIVWNDDRSVGLVVTNYQLAYELRKGASNTLGMIDVDLMEAWGDATSEDNCTIEEIR